MLKETGYQEKIEMLAPWLEEVLESIKKDLKNEHLKFDRQFCKRYFLGKNPSHVTTPEMVGAYSREIAEGNVNLGEFIATRWLLKNTDIYGYFEERIKSLAEDFEALDELPMELSEALMKSSIQQFGAKKTYLFSVFNSVVFPQKVYTQLRHQAETEKDAEEGEKAAARTAESLEAMQTRHQRELAALTDKFEKKFVGLQKKYLADMEALKKQIAALQKRLGS